MKTYLIIYSANETSKIVERIRSFQDRTHIKNRVWCISTDIESTGEVRSRFTDLLEANDMLLVIDISQSSWAAYNLPKSSVYWLKER